MPRTAVFSKDSLDHNGEEYRMPDRQRQWQGYGKKNQKDPASTKTVSSGYITCTPMRTTSEAIQFQERQTGCEVYAPDKERCFTRHSIFEQAFLYGGNPPDDLKHNFFLLRKARSYRLMPDGLPKGMKLIPAFGIFLEYGRFPHGR